jgi:hypothetical protein
VDFFWGKDNFEGLKTLSAAFRSEPRLKPLARYCDLREKGIRRQAFAELDIFLTNTVAWDPATQRSVALQVLEAHWATPKAHQFMSEPLWKRFIVPVLERWRKDDPENPVPLSYLALVRHDEELLKDALRQDPRNDRVRASLAWKLIRFVDYATHHLVEGGFIGKEADAAAALAEADEVLKGAPDPAMFQSLKGEVERLRTLLADWDEYRAAPSGDFPEWCRQRNRSHRWWHIAYYDGGAEGVPGTS